ncbi:alpha-N-acetylgalactosamine-specific lectin-like [Clinocottus analis]|uniref:alpha-N-acetylgalactosamine-specific lectin-like n=1 Tax=Clinocottus analis TaxID=304258 RepID=UPI0035BF6606
MLLLFLSGLALGAAAPSGEATQLQGNCPAFWTSFNNHCYKYVSNRMTWADAEIHCVSMRAHLASIHSLPEQRFVNALIRSHDITMGFTWIGLSDTLKAGTWLWTDGSMVDYRDWYAGQPDNNGNEHCVHTNFEGPNQWNDNKCYRVFEFVCKS